jgi:hypothetical protein
MRPPNDKHGVYWVKTQVAKRPLKPHPLVQVLDPDSTSGWEIANYIGNGDWEVFGEVNWFSDFWVVEISPEVLPPD